MSRFGGKGKCWTPHLFSGLPVPPPRDPCGARCFLAPAAARAARSSPCVFCLGLEPAVSLGARSSRTRAPLSGWPRNRQLPVCRQTHGHNRVPATPPVQVQDPRAGRSPGTPALPCHTPRTRTTAPKPGTSRSRVCFAAVTHGSLRKSTMMPPPAGLLRP